MENKLKQILFKVELEGRGVVNYDGNSQITFMNEHCGTKYFDNNYKCAKKAFYKKTDDITFWTDKNGKKYYDDMNYKLKISSYCIKSAMFNDTMDGYNSNITIDEDEFSHFITSEYGLLRGFVGVDKKIQPYNKKSTLEMCDAIENSGAVINMEIHTRNGNKDSTSDENSTSLFFQENVGDTLYETKGCINLKDMQFMSCDPEFGRLMFKPSWLEGEESLLHKQFMKHYGYIPYEEGYYKLSTSTFSDKRGERGIKLNNEFIVKLVKNLLKRILYTRISRSNAYAAVSKLQIKLVDKQVFNPYNDDEGWIDVNEDVIDNLNFDVFDFYTKCENNEIEEYRKNMESLASEKQEVRRLRNSTKKGNKDKDKGNTDK